jgi:hypothetical protein
MICGAIRDQIDSRRNYMQLPIDECEEWIWDSLNCSDDCGFEYVKNGNKEFLIFNTNDFFADAKAIEKIRRITGMVLLQISTHRGYSQLWFGRYHDGGAAHDDDHKMPMHKL